MPRLRASPSGICSSSRFGPSLSYLVTSSSPSTWDIGAELGKRIAPSGHRLRSRCFRLASARVDGSVSPWSLAHARAWTYWRFVAGASIHRSDCLAGPDLASKRRGHMSGIDCSRFRLNLWGFGVFDFRAFDSAPGQSTRFTHCLLLSLALTIWIKGWITLALRC